MLPLDQIKLSFPETARHLNILRMLTYFVDPKVCV